MRPMATSSKNLCAVLAIVQNGSSSSVIVTTVVGTGNITTTATTTNATHAMNGAVKCNGATKRKKLVEIGAENAGEKIGTSDVPTAMIVNRHAKTHETEMIGRGRRIVIAEMIGGNPKAVITEMTAGNLKTAIVEMTKKVPKIVIAKTDVAMIVID